MISPEDAAQDLDRLLETLSPSFLVVSSSKTRGDVIINDGDSDDDDDLEQEEPIDSELIKGMDDIMFHELISCIDGCYEGSTFIASKMTKKNKKTGKDEGEQKNNTKEESEKRLFSKIWFYELLEMCRKAERIKLSQQEMDNGQPMVQSKKGMNKALENNVINGDALRVLYSYHPSYVACHNRMDTARELTDFLKNAFSCSSTPDDTEEEDDDDDISLDNFLLFDEEKKEQDVLNTTTHSRRSVGQTTNSTRSLTLPRCSSSSRRSLLNTSTGSLRQVSFNREESLKALSRLVMESEDHRSTDINDSCHQTISNISMKEIEVATDELFINAKEEGGEHKEHDEDNDKEEERFVSFEDASSFLLRYPRNKQNDNSSYDVNDYLDGTLSIKYHNPFHVRAIDFVTKMDDIVSNHDCLNHHLLTSFSMGTFGTSSSSNQLKETSWILYNYMKAYQCFTIQFRTLLQNTKDLCHRSNHIHSQEHVDILHENMKEEAGQYDDETIHMMKSVLDIDPEPLTNVPHGELFNMCCDNLCRISALDDDVEENERTPFTQEQLSYIAAPLVEAFDEACCVPNTSTQNKKRTATAASSIAAMYFGSELIASQLYAKLCGYLLTCCSSSSTITKQDLAFFLLHMDMDVEHAQNMRRIVIDLAKTESSRIDIVRAVDGILKARVTLCDRFVQTMFRPSSGSHGGTHSAQLYNNQSSNWVRKGATCLSDFTGRPVVFEMCRPYVHSAYVLDVGCGEGYGARTMVQMGATRVIGLDVSDGMIEKARSHPDCNYEKEIYETCNATDLYKFVFHETPATLGIVPDARILKEGCFDLSIAIFLFNYTTLSEMKTIMKQIFKALKPNGHFIFSVPHPFMLSAHSASPSSDDNDNEQQQGTFSFTKDSNNNNDATSSYFSLRDRQFAGVIRTLDGRNLNVKMTFKTIGDYLDCLEEIGFSIEKIHEARVLPHHVSQHPEFFHSVKDSPLHLIFDVVKPTNNRPTGNDVKISTPKTTVMEPAVDGGMAKPLFWSSLEKKYANQVLTMTMSNVVHTQLEQFAITLCNTGYTEQTYQPNDDDITQHLSHVIQFAKQVRQRLAYETGAVKIVGLNMTHLATATTGSSTTQNDVNNNVLVQRAKMAYYLLSSLIGKVDGSSRGLLFDVIDKGLNTQDDNVLYSVSNDPIPWHTDASSSDKHYDVVGLLCIHPASHHGGTFHLSNAASAYHHRLMSSLPKFLLYELLRPLPRDIMEKGKGQGVLRGTTSNVDHLMILSRSSQLLQRRIRYNAHPIFKFASSQNKMQFRYMRHWIESGHTKGDIPLSPLLTIAMNILDYTLDQERVASTLLKEGEMVYCSNVMFAHGRDGFSNHKGGQQQQRHDNDQTNRTSSESNERHKVRAWLQIQHLL